MKREEGFKRPVGGFRPPIVDPEVSVSERASVSFPDLVRLLGEAVAEAQVSLDRASAAMTAELAATEVEVVPHVTERVQKNGDVVFESAPPRRVSLLQLGVMPTFYQFSEASVEVVMDVKIMENTTESGTFTLYADTQSVKAERKLNRDVSMTSKLRATLVPVPMPLRVEPSRTTTTPQTK